MKRKICAILLVLGMVLCQIPQTAAAAENTVPEAEAEEVTVGAKAESDRSVTPIILNEMSLVVNQPSIGGTTDTEAPDVTASDWTYEVTDAFWADSSGSALSTPLTFESDTTYYIAATVKTYWESDANYFFPQANLTVNIENGSVVGMPAITNVSDAGSTMQILIAVQPVVRRFGDQIQVWAGSIGGNTTMADSGGKVATNYTPSEPNVYDFGKDGTFSAGDIVQFYTGDEITVVAQADEGYRFAGWYRVNIDYNMSGGDTDHNGTTPNKAYIGSAFSTVSSFTYKPGETILSGDTEPLRYVCAVFEEDTASSHSANEIQVWTGDAAGNETGDSVTGGKVAVSYEPSYDDYPEDIVTKDGTEYGYSQIFGCYEGDEVTLLAQPDAGYHFVGWYPADGEWPKNGTEKYTGDMLSDQTTYTFEFIGTNRLICAVFAEDTVETVTVSFDPGTGTGSMDPVTVDAGAEYELPPCTFTHANTQRTFYAWSVDDELKDPGDTITVSKDTVVTAKWLDTTKAQTFDNSVDKSTTEVVCTLRLKDTRTGEVTEESVYKKTTKSGFAVPSNSTVEAMIREAGESAAARAREIAGHDVANISQSVSDLDILETINNRTYTYFEGTDDVGDYARYVIIDGELSHIWRYEVTVEAEYASSVVTLANQNQYWTGSPVAIGKAKVTGTTGAVTYRYYSDAKCKKEIAPDTVIEIGTYYVKAFAEADDKYAAAESKAAVLKILAVNIEKASVGGVSLSYGYSGKAYVPKLTVKVNGKTLAKDTDYTAVYANNKNPGTAKITIRGIGHYTGTRIKTFQIVDCASSLVSGKTYQLIPKNNSTTAVCSYSGRMVNNTKVYITNRSSSQAMKFKAIKNSDGTWKFINAKCELALAVQQNSSLAGKGLVLYDQTTQKAQNWKLTRKSDNSFAITNAVSGLYVSMSDISAPKGTLLTMHENSGRGDQRFYIVETSAVSAPFAGTYAVKASKDKAYGLNIASSSKKDGANVNLYKYSNNNAKKFKVMYSGGGFYRLVNVNSGLCLTVKGNTRANGANVIQSKWAAQSGQRWKIIKNSNGTVTFQNALGTMLQLNGNKTASGTNVASRKASTTGAQQWYLE